MSVCNWTSGNVSAVVSKVDFLYQNSNLNRYNMYKFLLNALYYISLGYLREEARDAELNGIIKSNRLLTGGKVMTFSIYNRGVNIESVTINHVDWTNQEPGLVITTDYLNYTSGFWQYELTGYLYLPTAEVLAWARDLINFAQETQQVGEYDSVNGMKGAKLGELFGFDTIPETEIQFLTKWLKLIIPEWKRGVEEP